MARLRRVLLSVLAAALAVGCIQEELIDSLSQRESIEVLAVLQRSGISAEREKTSRSAGYSVLVSAGDKQRATEVLHRYGFPREPEESVEELTRQHGFVPNPAQLNQVRLDRALAAEIERLLVALGGIIDARVVVRSNLAESDGDGQPGQAKASVVVRYMSSAGKQPFSDEQLRQMVANAVPGMSADAVTVSVSRVLAPDDGGLLSGDRVNPLETLEPFKFQVPNSQREQAQRQVALVVVIIAVAGIFLGLAFGWIAGKRRGEQSVRRIAGSEQDESFFIEAAGAAGRRPGALTSGSKR